jgi:hypothetical protein
MVYWGRFTLFEINPTAGDFTGITFLSETQENRLYQSHFHTFCHGLRWEPVLLAE